SRLPLSCVPGYSKGCVVAWPLRTNDVKRLQVSNHRCLRIVADFGWRQRVSDEVIRKQVFGCAAGTSIRENIQHQRLRWLSHVLRMPKNRLPRRVLFSVPPSGWLEPRGWVPVIPFEIGWRRCEKWRLIDVSGVRAVNFYCLIERLERLWAKKRLGEADNHDEICVLLRLMYANYTRLVISIVNSKPTLDRIMSATDLHCSC
ncbi:hypothetical protein T265_12976, partial [Opisthorchis viverrini]